MKVITFPNKAKVEIEAGDNIYSVVNDSKNQLRGYRHSYAAIMDAINKSPKLKGRQWWLLPGDKLELEQMPENPADLVKARTRNRHYFELHKLQRRIIDVYIGFMDEEVNARLNTLIQIEAAKRAGQQRPVILLERGKIDPGKPILEWRLGNYPIAGAQTPIRKIVHVSPKGEIPKWVQNKKGEFAESVESVNMPTNLRIKSEWFRKWRLRRWADNQKVSIDPEDIIGRAMGVFMMFDLSSDLEWLDSRLRVKKYFDIIKMLQHRKVGKGTKSGVPDDVSGDGPWLSVVRFDVGGSNLLPPVIVIRSPEMGLQPSLMCPYLAFLFKALSVASSEFAAIEGEQRKLIIRAPATSKTLKTKEEKWERVDPKERKIYKSGYKLRKWPLWEWPLRVSQFGVQGSTSALQEYRPGSIDTVIASLYVGVEISNDVLVTSVRRGADDGQPGFRGKFEHAVDGTANDPQWVSSRGVRPPDSHLDARPPGFGAVSGGPTTTHAYAVISLCTPAGVYDFLRAEVNTFRDVDGLRRYFRLKPLASGRRGASPLPDKVNAAQEAAKEIFRTQEHRKAWKRITLFRRKIDEKNPFGEFEKRLFRDGEHPTLQDVIGKIESLYAGSVFKRRDSRRPVITLTVSYFGGDKDKAAADALGIRGVAMEDYHVIRVLRSAMTKGVLEKSDYPIIYDWRVDRINADPKKLPPNVEKDFNNFYRTQKRRAERTAPGMAALLTIDDYIKVVIWGLRGVLRGDVSHEELRNSVDWKYARTIPARERPKYFWSFAGNVGSDDFFIPDPFCIEIATDFINTLAEMNPDKADSGISNFTYGRANKERARELAGAVQEAWLKEDTANSTWKTIYDSAAPEGTKARIKMLMEHLRDNCGFGIEGADRRYVKTWLRPGGKWEGVGSYATLQDATNDSRFKAAAIDRAFYKSSNMMALQTYADHGIWNDSPPRPAR